MGNKSSHIPRLQNLASPNPDDETSVDLDRRQLMRDLTLIGDYVRANPPLWITLVVVGGAVNVIHLQSRHTTHDVDWFKPNLSRREGDILRRAYLYAVGKGNEEGIPLPQSAFNNKTTLFISSAIREALYQEAKRQNDTVFHSGGFRLLAAPWDYAFVSKLDRVFGGTWNTNDLSDAASHLDRFLTRTKTSKIEIGAIESLREIYRTKRPLERTGLSMVNEEYQRMFGKEAILR